MVVKIYISGISGNKEVKKRQQRVLMILDSKSIKYELIDITEPGKESDKEYMQSNSKSNGGTVSDPNPRSPLPPQMFNDDEYCGDYDQFDLANEVDTLEQFLKLEVPPEEPLPAEPEKEKAVNGDVTEENKKSNEDTQVTSTDDNPAANGETAAKESTPIKEESPVKEGTPLREATPVDGKAKESDVLAKGDSKEATPERQKSVDKEATPEKVASPEKDLESKKSSKENTPEKEEPVNENGTVSSRETSQEKDKIDETIVESKKDPSELLIQSEQTAAE